MGRINNTILSVSTQNPNPIDGTYSQVSAHRVAAKGALASCSSGSGLHLTLPHLQHRFSPHPPYPALLPEGGAMPLPAGVCDHSRVNLLQPQGVSLENS